MTELILPFVLDIQQALHGALQAIPNPLPGGEPVK